MVKLSAESLLSSSNDLQRNLYQNRTLTSPFRVCHHRAPSLVSPPELCPAEERAWHLSEDWGGEIVAVVEYELTLYPPAPLFGSHATEFPLNYFWWLILQQCKCSAVLWRSLCEGEWWGRLRAEPGRALITPWEVKPNSSVCLCVCICVCLCVSLCVSVCGCVWVCRINWEPRESGARCALSPRKQ